MQIDLEVNNYIQWLIVISLGLSFGSFVSLISHRLPLDEHAIWDRSRCTSCGTKLGVRDLAPLLSWLFLGGKCRYCGAGIRVRYPIIEVMSAASFSGIFALYGASLVFIWLALLAVCVLTLIVTDLEHYIIPDSIQVAMAVLAVAYHATLGSNPEPLAYGALAGLGAGLALRYGYSWLRKKEGLGLGDVKFLAVAGLWLGLSPLIPFLVLSGKNAKLKIAGQYIRLPGYGQKEHKTLGNWYTTLLNAQRSPIERYGDLDLEMACKILPQSWPLVQISLICSRRACRPRGAWRDSPVLPPWLS